MLKGTTLNPEIKDESEYFHRGTFLWGLGMDWRAYGSYWEGANDLTREQWIDIETGWTWIDNKFNEDMKHEYNKTAQTQS